MQTCCDCDRHIINLIFYHVTRLLQFNLHTLIFNSFINFYNNYKYIYTHTSYNDYVTFLNIHNFIYGFNIFNKASWKSPPRSCLMLFSRSRPDNSLNLSVIIFRSISLLSKKTLMIVSSSLSGPFWKNITRSKLIISSN